MKPWIRISMLGAIASAFGLALIANAATTTPIASSLHNMNVAFGPNTISGNQICLPCHTPHQHAALNTNQPDDVLWNHAMSTATSKLYYSAHQTRYSSTGALPDLDETSKLCLSCHDGTVAVDNYVTGPGAGKTTSTNTMTGAFVGFQVGGGGDLTHDHPVGIRYPGLDGTVDPKTAAAASGYNAASTLGTAPTGVTAVGGGAVKLFVNGSETYASVVSCGSCHTPHSNAYHFLRIPNDNSQLCLKCHDK